MSAHKQNFANGVNFFAQFSYKDEVFKYFLQNIKLPDVQAGVTPIYKNGTLIHLPGNSHDSGNIPLTFIVDEDFEVYTNMIDLQQEYMKTSQSIDLFEVFVQNNQNVNIIKFVFEGIHFSSVQGPSLQTTVDETEIYCDVIMEFSNWYYQRLR